ncbi:MAG: hypothetical protein IT269_06095 [Saprospiraceae bacterium]|nr:hypothetical protein [Saprospiraceae bacterium]
MANLKREVYEMTRIAFSLLAVFSLIMICSCKNSSTTPESAPVVKRESWKDHGCELITDAELEKMFSFDAKATFLNSRSLPDQVFCLRTWKKPDWKERESFNERTPDKWLNPENRLVIQLFDYLYPDLSKQQMDGLRRDRRNTYDLDVTGVGEDALWSTSTLTLLARKGKYTISITLEYLDDSAQNLPKAKEVALLALSRI